MIDPAAPFADRSHRIAAAKEQVPGVQAEADRGVFQDALDLPGGFDVGARLVVKSGYVASLAAACHRHLDAFRESFPTFGVKTQRAVTGGLTRL